MVKDFTDLLVWQKAHSMVVMIYQLVSNFPKFEQYGLSDQMRRSAVSVTSNIAEGFGRQTAKEKGQYYYLAKGSLTELRNQLYVARDVGYVTLTEVNKILIIMEEVYKMLFGLLKTTKLSIPTS